MIAVQEILYKLGEGKGEGRAFSASISIIHMQHDSIYFFGPFCKRPLKQAAEIMPVNIIKSAYLCRKHLPVPID